MKTIVSLVGVGALALTACGGSSNTSDASTAIDGPAAGIDAPHLAIDAAPSNPDARLGIASCFTGALGTAPSSVQVTGESVTIDLSGESLLPGVDVAAYRSGFADPLVTTVSSQQTNTSGQFGLTIDTSGTAVDGYLLGTYPGYLDTYLSPPAPISATLANAALLLVTSTTLTELGDVALGSGGATLDKSKGVIGIVILDGAGAGVPGAVVTTEPAGLIRYNGTSGFPDPSTTATATDGAAYAINVDPGCVTVSVTVSGVTYPSTQVRVFPASGSITTTALTPAAQ